MKIISKSSKLKDLVLKTVLELMAFRDIIKFSEDKLSFEVINPKLVDYYANHVTSLTEERGKFDN